MYCAINSCVKVKPAEISIGAPSKFRTYKTKEVKQGSQDGISFFKQFIYIMSIRHFSTKKSLGFNWIKWKQLNQ